jgi:hypothetical protein
MYEFRLTTDPLPVTRVVGASIAVK